MQDLDRDAARCLIVGIKGPVATVEELELIRRGVGGVILFARNVKDPAQVAELSRSLKAAARGPLLVSIDQEGGRVQRLRAPHWTEWPSLRRLGRLDEAGGVAGLSGVEVVDRVGRMIAHELAACGIDLDYAPVMDVDTNANNPVIADRSFSRSPQRVARLGVAMAKALESQGVASCAKHFPGHGDTSQDSHKTLPRLAHDKERLWEVELVPFVAAARAGLASVMTAHVRFEGFDRTPATLSSAAMTLLRKEVEFRGCCISDDLEMKAIADMYGTADAAELSIEAGVDAVLICHTLGFQHDAIDGIARSGRSGPLPRARLAEAAAHVELLQKFARPASAVDPSRAAAGCATQEHKAFAAQLFEPEGELAERRRNDPTEWRT